MSVEWQFLLTLNDRLRALQDPVEIQEVAVRLLGEHLHANRVQYAQITGDQFVIRRSYVRDVPPFRDRDSVNRFGKPIVEACRGGETVAVSDVRSDSRFTAAERTDLLASQVAAMVEAPLIKEGHWVATLAVHSATPRTWTRDQIAVIETTAQRTWAASERARAEETLGRIERRQAFLQELSTTIRPLADPARILAETCRLLGTHLQVNRVAYGEVEGEEYIVANEYVDGVPSQSGRFRWTDLGGSRADEILKGGTLVVNDTAAEAHTESERAGLQAAGIGAYLCPLLIKDGRFVASFGVHSRTARIWTSDEIALVQEVADRTWATLERRKAEAELRANEDRLKFVLRLNDALRPLSDPGDVQETAARLLAEHLDVTRVGYAEITPGRDYNIRREHARGVPSLADVDEQRLSGEEMRAAFRRGEMVVVTDARTDARLNDEERATLLSRQIAAFVGAALFKGGQMVAAFGANHAAPRQWTPSEIELVRDVAERTWDAVERTRAETALREQQQRLHLALEASAGGSWTWSAATNHVDWDARFRALYGFPADEPASTDAWIPLVHEEDRPRILASLNEILTSPTKNSWENTFRIVRPDGTIAWIQSRGRADRDADGRVARLSGLDLDFSQHRRIEEAQQAHRDEEHDRTLRTLLEIATQGVVSVDAQGVIVTANHAFSAMFGWPSRDLIGQPIERVIPAALRDVPEPGAGRHLIGARRDGSTFPIELSVNHVPTLKGRRTFAFVTDITERHRAALALQERTAELEYRTTQLSRMASELTLAEQHAREQIAKTLHDGLQQLLVIAALSLDQLLKRETDGSAAPTELLTVAKHQLDDAIAAARSLNVELFPPVLQYSGLPNALRWLASWTRDKYKLDVAVVADPRADTARKEVRTLLFESVRELLFNAVKHARTDRVGLELTLDGDDRLCITVSDRGVGFEPARLDDRSRAGPMGWGLFSIRERLTLLGGGFEIDSAPGSGTRVRLVAPRGAPPAPVAALEMLDLAPIAPVVSRASGRASPDALRILIVDDHAAVRSALRQMLQERPQLSVVGDASNGFEAIAHAHTLGPDIILMDVTMPHMDGIEATRHIHAELPDIQILGLSVQPRSETLHAIEQAGAAAFFVKGVDMQRLIDYLLLIHASRTASASAPP